MQQQPQEPLALFDAHAHYDDARFAQELPQGPQVLLQELFDKNTVCGVCNSASDLASARAAQALAAQYEKVVFTAGIHPHQAQQATQQTEQKVLSELGELLADPKCVAIGEIGLDYHYDFSPQQEQQRWFMLQMELAAQTGKPVVIHSREAVAPTISVLHAYPSVRGILHSCSFSAECVQECLRMGYYVSFSGSVTFRNASGLLDAVRAVPDERLLLETDCPYLAPVPMRGKLNHSGYLQYTAQLLATARGTTPEHIAQITRENAYAVFGLTAES